MNENIEKKTNMFEGAKFGDHYIFDGNSDCIFLEKMKQSEECMPLYRLVACEERRFRDKNGKIYTENILRDVIAQEDGFCYEYYEEDEVAPHRVYVTKHI